MIFEGINTLLTNDPGMPLVGDAIYPVAIPKGALPPCITYQQISAGVAPLLDGAGDEQFVRIQFDCWATAYSDAKKMQAELKSLLMGFVGKLSDGTIVQATTLTMETDFFESDSLTYRAMSEFTFYF